MTLPPTVALTGPSGRLGRSLLEVLPGRTTVLRWGRPDYDLDDPASAARLVARDGPALVIACAAWTDVDGCAQEPELALRRNGTAIGELAEACAERGIGLVLLSTNEVFGGRRTDGRGYGEDEPIGPANPYGASKAAGEQAARAAFAAAGLSHLLWIIRTAWLYGPPGNDFPARILAAADGLPGERALRVVADEIGTPTYTRDLAPAVLELISIAPGGTYHLVGAGVASRLEYAEAVLAACRPGARLEPISSTEYARDSRPPAWGVLDASRAAAYGIRLRLWPDALADYLATLC